MSNVRSLPAPQTRISAKLRKAIDIRIKEGRTINDACDKAGLSSSGWHKAMQRPAVRDHLAKVQADYVREAEVLKTTMRTRALEVAADLMENAKSETVRARMAEFLLSEGKGVPQVSVHVDARQPSPGGYEFVRPGERMVEIEAEDDAGAKSQHAETGK